MKISQLLKALLCSIVFTISSSVYSQINDGVYISDVENIHHELKYSNGYFIHSVYEKSPAKFIKSLGGFAEIKGHTLKVMLEFNSAYEIDSVQQLNIPFKIRNNKLQLQLKSELIFEPVIEQTQDLDGAWLFGTRGPDTGQKRRGEESARKTLKFLINGRFQWIAFHTETFKFSGTGGGSYTAKDGVYSENIEYFSRDDSRVGASLNFNYEIKENDWHHTGKNSKDEPMYEIWTHRN